ncbi:hypothetical protein ABZ078_00670 [Streptomyces sp. NPDC006385]|uniref:hypothetical protein n=1 Tax=Streptomyces sp. NPDC006385 TaxID=3156761 RepID=UPI0033A6098B
MEQVLDHEPAVAERMPAGPDRATDLRTADTPSDPATARAELMATLRSALGVVGEGGA